jgi:predicted kinase
MAAYAIAEDNLRLGHIVIADSVNPLAVTRAAWRRVARVSSADLLEVEVICSDETEHRRRVETRSSDVPGLTLPDWDAVERRDYEPWPEPHLTIDTAMSSAEEASARILAEIGGRLRA